MARFIPKHRNNQSTHSIELIHVERLVVCAYKEGHESNALGNKILKVQIKGIPVQQNRAAPQGVSRQALPGYRDYLHL